MEELVNRFSGYDIHFIRGPGGEYPKKLVFRNVEMKTQHIKYNLPVTKYFGMNFPQLIVLSPGMSTSIEVTFRPIEKVIKCHKNNGKMNNIQRI